ncbi:hypothetical protein FACS189476_11950 [Spirochaetia bacterium]|nr:hypothetical protein FACS189476_11950 [Spirochaetia bacterium]
MQQGIPDDIGPGRKTFNGIGKDLGKDEVIILYLVGGIDKDKAPPGQGREKALKPRKAILLAEAETPVPAKEDIESRKILGVQFKAAGPVFISQQLPDNFRGAGILNRARSSRVQAGSWVPLLIGQVRCAAGEFQIAPDQCGQGRLVRGG